MKPAERSDTRLQAPSAVLAWLNLTTPADDPPLAFLVLDADQLAELLGRARELLRTSA